MALLKVEQCFEQKKYRARVLTDVDTVGGREALQQKSTLHRHAKHLFVAFVVRDHGGDDGMGKASFAGAVSRV